MKKLSLSKAGSLVMAAAATLSLSLGLVGHGLPVAHADERDDAQSQLNSANQKEAQLRSSLEGVDAKLGQAYLDAQNANTQLAAAKTELAKVQQIQAQALQTQQQVNTQLASAQAQQEQLNKQATNSSKEANASKAAVASLVVSTYQGDNSLTTLSYVLQSDSVAQMTERSNVTQVASSVQESILADAEAQRAKDANRKARQDAVAKRISNLKVQADKAAQEATDAANQAATKRNEVSARASAASAAASNLETQKAGLQAQLDQVSKDQAAAQAKIAKIDAANAQAVASGSMTNASSSSARSDSLGSGYIGHPIPAPWVVTSPFGYRIHPVTGTAQGHAGTDFAADCNQPQYAPAAGVATYWYSVSCGIGLDINLGYIDGHSYNITLCHMSGRAVGDGASVSRGQVVGYTGATGYATGCHVHFEVTRDGVNIDPMSLPGF